MNQLAAFWHSLSGRTTGYGKLFLFLLILCGFSGSALGQSAGAPTTVYVDDDFSGSGANAPVSFVGNPGPTCAAASATFGHDAFDTITDALAHVADGGTVCVAAGTYAETDGAGNNLIIDKPVRLYGAQAGLDARNRSDTGASSIIPAVGVPNLGYDDSDGTIVEINSDGVVLDGFVLDGDNPAITTGLAMGAADPDVAVGIIATGSDTQIRNNVIRNLVYAGIFGLSYPTTLPAANNNVIAHNWIQNLDAPSSWGIAIVVGYNFYADIDSNLLDDVRIGIQTNYYNKPAAAGTDAFIRNNEVHASQLGIYFHYFDPGSSPFTVSGNQIFANANANQAGRWSGIMVSTFYGNTLGYVENNDIDGIALAGSGRLRAGYQVVLISTIHADDLSIDGGSVSNVDDGVLVTDGAYFAGPVNNITVQNVAFSNVARAAFHVEDTLMIGTETTDHSPKITIGADNTFSGVAHQGALTGPLATIAYAPGAPMLDSLLVRAAGLGHRGASADSKDNVRAAANALINAGITAVASGGTVGVESGTFAENVLANKPVTLLGPHAGVHGNDAARGTAEAIIIPASGIGVRFAAPDTAVDGFTIGSGSGHAVLRNGGSVANNLRLVNNRIQNVTSGSGVFSEPGAAGNGQGFEIANNLFTAISGTGPSGGRGIVLFKGTSSAVIENNDFTAPIALYAMQINGGNGVVDNVAVTSNRISGTGSTAMVITGTTNVSVSGNKATDVREALFISDRMTDFTASCNVLSAINHGISTDPYWSNTPNSNIRIFDNAISGGIADIRNGLSQPLTIGSNWYGGSTSNTSGSVQLADALVADPTNGGAFDVVGCGDNTPTQIIAYAGNGQATPINTAFGQPLVARVQDVLGGAVITPHAVTFSAPASGASASLSSLGGSTDYNGTVSTSATANGIVGDYAVSAATGSFAASAGFALTNAKSTGTVNFDPLAAPYATAHAVSATLSPADTNVTCTPVSGVPAQSAAPGNYLVSASCEGDNYVATGTATYVVTASTASIESVAGSAPVGVVTVDPQPDADSKKSYFSWVINGSAAENVVAEFVIGTGNASPQPGDLTLEYLEIFDNSWQPLPLSFDSGTGTWAGVFGTATGFPLIDGTQSQFRATLQRGGRYVTTANLVGVASGLTLATSQPVATDVADIDLVGSGNAAGVVGVAVDTGYSLVNSGTAALSKGDLYPAEAAPNNENVRGRFFIEWDGGALTPADPNGAGGNGSNCGAETCASPDVSIEFFDATSSSYQPIHNLRAELDGSNQPTGRLYGYFGARTSGGVPVPAGYSGTYLFRTTSKAHTGNYTVISQVVGIDTGTVYAEAAPQNIGIDTGEAASIMIVSGDGGEATVGGTGYDMGDLIVEVRDIGNNPVAGATVAFNVLPGLDGAGASLSVPAITDANGRTQVIANSNTIAGVFEVNATLSNHATLANPFALRNLADTDPAQVQITMVSGDAQTAQVGNAYGLPLVAKVTDQFGNPLEALDVEFSAPATGASVSPIGVSGLTDADGLVDSGTLTANATAGGFSVSASIDALACTSGSCSVGYALTNTAAGAANVTLVSSTASAVVGTPGAYALTATVTDDDSNPVPGVSVTLVGPSSGAGVTPALHAGLTDIGGQVMHVFDANTMAGAFQVQAVVSGVTPTDVSLTNLADAAAKIVYVAGDGQSAAVGAAFATDLTVRVVDQYDNPVADSAAETVTFTAQGTGASATVISPATSGANGLVSTPATANSEVGNYSVTASFNGHDVSFALANTTGSVSISDIVWTDSSAASTAYDGSAKSATATVTGSSLTPSFTYNGSATAPTNAGSYQVIATIDDGNVYGTASAMLTITPAAAGSSGITITGSTSTYDGSYRPATVNNPGGVNYSLAYDTGNGLPPVNVGTYTATLTVNDPNHAAETLTAAIEITPADVTLSFGSLSHVYDGTAKAATVMTSPPGVTGVSLSYSPDAAPEDAGTYTVTATLSNPNYVLAGPDTATLEIVKASAQILLSNLTHVYDGAAKSATVTTVPATLAGDVVVVYAPANPTNVGSYAVTATLAGHANYADATANGTLTIVAATIAGFDIVGDDSFTGTAGDVLSAPLPTVRVFDTLNNGVASISVQFNITSGGGSILGNSNALVVTDSSGLASVPEWMLGAVAGSNTMTATVSGMAGLPTLEFDATGEQVAQLSISKEVDLAQAHAGQVLNYTITVENDGPSTVSATLLDALPTGLDAISWICLSEDGAVCGQNSGTSDINFASDIPANGRIIVTVSATVSASATTGEAMVNTAAVEWTSGGATEEAEDQASTNIVPAESGPCSIFCDGFEGVDTGGRDLAMPDNATPAALRGWTLGTATSGKPVLAVELIDSAGNPVAWLDSLTVGQQRLLRLRHLDADGMQRAGSWQAWPMEAAVGHSWDQTMDGLTMRFMPVGTQLAHAGSMLQLRLPAGSAIPVRAITHSATAY